MSTLIDSFVKVVGIENVTTDFQSLSEVEATTYPTTQKIIAVVRPSDKVQLQECIRLANQFKVPVYPVSGGKNWGYGSRVPVGDQEVVIDLSQLDQISDFDEKLGYVTIGPGVTYQQLFDFLRERNSELLISITSSSTNSSLVGNIMERGIGTGLYADRLSSVCGFEVLLPNGEYIKTGFGELSDAVTGKVFRWGAGPYMDGIFTQSNLGIVTELTLWLMPCPDYFQILFYQINGGENFSRFTDVLQEMMLKGLVRPTVSLFNFHRVIATMGRFPWADEDEIIRTRSIDKVNAIRKSIQTPFSVGLWNGEISIRGINKEHTDYQCALIKEKIEPLVEQLVVYEVSKEEMIALLKGYPIEKEGVTHDLVKDILIKKYLGIPNDSAIRQCYWRMKTSIPAKMNPDTDQCGLLWFSPIVPFRSQYLNRAIEIMEKTVEDYGLEPAISLQCMSERSIHVIASITWDRSVPGEDENALGCYRTLRKKLNQEGFHFYRESTFSMNEPYEQNNYHTFLQTIKKSLDPNNILAPGRYIKDTRI